MKKRETLSKDEVLSLSERIFENFIEQFALLPKQKVHCFLTITEKNEIDTQIFLDYFYENNIRVFVPKIFEGKLINVEISKETIFVKSTWNILEPVSNLDSGEVNFDFVFTPLLYCDHTGNRVGYGKGFYDRFFEKINSDAIKVGLNFFSPQQKIEDVSENDVPIDYLITPTEVLSFLGFKSKSTK